MARSYLDKMEELRASLGELEKFRIEAHMGTGVSTKFHNFFRVNYELIEYLKYDFKDSGFNGKNGVVESFIKSDKNLIVAIDICNKEKDPEFKYPRMEFDYGNINLNTAIDFSITGATAQTDLKYTMNGRMRSGYKLAKYCLERWEAFFEIHDLNRK